MRVIIIEKMSGWDKLHHTLIKVIFAVDKLFFSIINAISLDNLVIINHFAILLENE